jgi:hypothetical protein
MKVTIEMPAEEIAAIRRSTRLEDDAQATVQAAREFVRLRKLHELKSASGKVEFDSQWRQLEDLELMEPILISTSSTT